MPFFLNFNSSSSIPSVLLCERRIHVSAHGWRGDFGDLVLISSAFVLMYNAFIGVFLLLSAFWRSFLGMGSFVFNILFTLLLSMGP